MTLEETLERSIVVSFNHSNPPIFIIYFQHEVLRNELYDSVKAELLINPLSLEIDDIKEGRLIFRLVSPDGLKVFSSKEVGYFDGQLKNFIANVNKDANICLYTDYGNIQGSFYPAHKWLTQQYDIDQPMLNGYYVVQSI